MKRASSARAAAADYPRPAVVANALFRVGRAARTLYNSAAGRTADERGRQSPTGQRDSERGGFRPLPAAPLHRRTCQPTNATPATSRSISPALPRCWRAIPRRCCSAPPGPRRQELVGNVMGGRARLAARSAWSPARCSTRFQRRLRNKPDIVEVSRAEAPCQQVVLTGDDADVTKLPVHLQHGADGAPYISSSIDYVIDPQDRLDQRRAAPADAALAARRPASIWSRRAICGDLRGERRGAGKPLPVSFVVGAHPIDHVAGVMRMPVDELGLVAALRDAPLPVVKCVTNDIRVPADAEYVHRGLSRRARPRRAGGAVRRVPRLLRRGQAQSGVPLTAITQRRTRCSRPRPSAGRPGPHRHGAAFGAAHRSDRSGARCRPRCASRSRSMPPRRAAARSTCASRCASACRARRATPSARAWARSPTARTCSWSIPTSTSSPTSRWTGRWRRASSPTAT